MRKILILTTFCLISVKAFAQNPLKIGEKQLNAGFGLSSYGGTPVYVGLEFGVHEDISVAGELSYQSKNYNYAKVSGLGITARGNYHFNRILEIEDKWDVYAGAGLSYFNWNYKANSGFANYNYDHDSGIYLSAQIGGRYFFSEKFGVNLEFGGGNLNGGKLGITVKL